MLLKLLERIVLNRILTKLPPGFFHRLQFGFRSKHDTLGAIACLLSRIRRALDRHCYLPVAFLDLIKAFDGTQPVFRQSPPMRCFSMSVTLARTAAAM